MNVSLDYYKTFYYVAKLGSITLAAEALYVSQPAVSQSVRQLEEALGCSLFFRTRSGVQMTPEGKALYFHVEKGYEQILLGEKKVEGMLDFEAGEVRIGASDMTLQFYLLPFLEKFHKKHPKIKISVTNSSTPVTVSALREGKIDLGVVGSPVENYKDLSVREVAEIRDIFIAGDEFRALKGKTLSLKELKEYPIVCLGRETSTRHYLDEFFHSHGALLEPDFEVATSDLVAPFVERNMGIGIVVRFFAEDSIRKGRAFEVQTEHSIPARSICIVSGSRGQISHAAQEFLNTLK